MNIGSHRSSLAASITLEEDIAFLFIEVQYLFLSITQWCNLSQLRAI